MAKARRPHSINRSSESIPFRIAAVCWIDLLGYGSAMSGARFNPLHHAAKDAISRLRRFHRIVSEKSHRHFPTLVMNDGAAAYRDLPLQSNSATYDFLRRSYDLHRAIAVAEKKSGDPGARMVVATGFRMLGRRAGLDARRKFNRSVIERLDAREITASQALKEHEEFRPTFDSVPQLQANFAFTKAYLAEQAGAKGGLAGPHCFVDMAFFSRTSPAVTLGPRIAWCHPELAIDAEFARIVALHDLKKAVRTILEVRTGLEIGVHLTDDPNLLSMLQKSQK